jgi:hypothetical protein
MWPSSNTSSLCVYRCPRIMLPHCIVSTETGIRSWWSGFNSRRGSDEVFPHHHRVQTGSVAQPVSYPLGTGGSFPGDKATPASSSNVKNAWSYTFTPPIRLRCGVKVKVKVKLSLSFLNWSPRHEGLLGSGGIPPRIIELGTRWRWVVSFTPWPLYPRGKSLWYLLDRRLGGPQIRSGRGSEEKNSQPPPGIEP